MVDADTTRRGGWRAWAFMAGLGMAVFSALTIQHFFAANYPASIFEGSFCDINAFFNCDSSAYASIAAVAGVPIGTFGMLLGGLVMLGAVFPSPALDRTGLALSAWNLVGVVALFFYSVLVLGSLCLLCSGYYLFSIAGFAVYWLYGPDRRDGWRRWIRSSPRHLAAFAVVSLVAAYGMAEYHAARRDAQAGGVTARVVSQYFALPEVPWPSEISPYWTARATDGFEDAPIRVVEYGDLLCSDCQILYDQLKRLKQEFDGRLNLAFQFFPLEAACNDVVEKDKHPGACEASYMAARDPAQFAAIHDEIFENMQAAKDPAWRADLARRHGVEDAATDPATRELVQRLIRTGAEYEKTSEEYRHGIRSTPTMIINNRMVIGTLPYEQLRAIFQAIVDREAGERGFMESWVEG